MIKNEIFKNGGKGKMNYEDIIFEKKDRIARIT
ncbi:MAG: hypothetical protein K940chlam5_01525, partial [Candidatus Anoxychlamydiales bacterium]|nr:hypothetical protein [Candidatus Anoxychlamydiales bacterium]